MDKIRNYALKILLILGGALSACLIVESALRVAGDLSLRGQERQNSVSLAERDAVRILCIGESTTADQYPKFLGPILNGMPLNRKFVVIDRGVVGTNTGIVLTRLKKYLDNDRPELVVAMLGVNDESWSVPLDERAPRSRKFMKWFENLRMTKLIRISLGRPAAGSRPNGPANPLATAPLREAIRHENQADWEKAETVYTKILEQDPNNEEALVGLGRVKGVHGDRAARENYWRKALLVNPRNEELLIDLAKVYKEKRQLEETAKLYRTALDVNPRNAFVLVELGRIYQHLGEWEKAEECFRQASAMGDDSEVSMEFSLQAEQMLSTKEKRSADQEGVNSPPIDFYPPITRTNYQKIRDLVLERGIKLLCVQYPLRDVRPLRKMIGNHEQVFFVDAKAVFEEAVEKRGYEKYFIDRFAGDFGHCTPLGNELLAENIAKVIAEEVYGQQGAKN